jgi:hypothetical protein
MNEEKNSVSAADLEATFSRFNAAIVAATTIKKVPHENDEGEREGEGEDSEAKPK